MNDLKAQLTKQTQLTDKAKAEALKIKEDWEKQKTVLASKLEKEKGKNKTIQEKKTGISNCETRLPSRIEEENLR
jgi:hypothetical protein